MIKSYLHIKESPRRGRGVFTKEAITAGTIIEVSPVIVLPIKQVKNCLKTRLHDYVFKWGESTRKIGVVLGWGSVYNHSYRSNCQYTPNFKKNTLTIRTVRAIAKGEELFVNYNRTWNDETPVWFDVK